MEIQYFLNEGRPGLAKHVLKIRVLGQFKPVNVIMTLTDDVRRINYKARSGIGGDEGAAIIKKAKAYRKEKKLCLFGFRLNQESHAYTKADGKPGRFFKQQYNTQLQCWAFLTDTGMDIELMWNGEMIKTSLTNSERKGAKSCVAVCELSPADDVLAAALAKKKEVSIARSRMTAAELKIYASDRTKKLKKIASQSFIDMASFSKLSVNREVNRIRIAMSAMIHKHSQ